MKNRTKKSPEKTKVPASHADKLACMDYLHGDVVDGEFQAACEYEYARESMVIREAAKLSVSGMDGAEMAFKLEEQFQCNDWFIQHPWGFIWECPSFPAKSWNQLGEKERAHILMVYPLSAGKVQPLRMNEVTMLDAMGIFDHFKAMAVEAREARKRNFGNPKPVPKVHPIIEGWPKQKMEKAPWVHALFTVDFTKKQDRLKDEFVAWLKLPENEVRFVDYKRPAQRTDTFKDRLKALAAWRLHDAFGGDYREAVAFAADHRLPFKRAQKIGGTSYKFGEPRPFHNPGRKKDKSGKKLQKKKAIRLNQEPLFRDEQAYDKSIRAAKRYRGEIIPWEYGIYAAEREAQLIKRRTEMMSVFKAALKQAKKTSTKSS